LRQTSWLEPLELRDVTTELVIDLDEFKDWAIGESADETDDATCQMCGNEGPKWHEAKLRNRAARRTRWLQRKWRVSAMGAGKTHTSGSEGHSGRR